MRRRRFLAAAVASALPLPAPAQEAKRGRVKLELPLLVDNGNSVPLKVRIESPMTEADHVARLTLISERNPERQMAVFHFRPNTGIAEITTRVRLAGSQRVIALAEMSDGSRWMDEVQTVVTLSACIDGTG